MSENASNWQNFAKQAEAPDKNSPNGIEKIKNRALATKGTFLSD